MTWLEERLAKEDRNYYRIILRDPEHHISDGELPENGFFKGVGKVLDMIYEWDDSQVEELHDDINYLLSKLENALPYPNVSKDLKAKFAYKKEAFLSIYDLLDELSDRLEDLDMGFSLEYEEVEPDQIVYEDDYQIAYL